MRKAGTTSPFGARVFTELVVVANEAAQLLNRVRGDQATPKAPEG
jgi:hypothetical protein